MYVEQFGINNDQASIVFIHGGYHTGACYTQTPDGRLGWAPLLTQKGYKVYVTDMPGMGRSGSIPFEDINGDFIVKAYVDLIKNIQGKVILVTHSLSGPFGFRVGELLPKQVVGIVSIEPALPGNIETVVKPYFESENIIKAKLKELDWILDLDKYSYPTKQLIDSFTSGATIQFPDDEQSLNQYRSSLQKMHPRLLYERLNINNTQIRINDYSKLKNTSCLVITSPKNPVHVIDDKKIPDTFRPHGIQVDHYNLSDIGIEGNGHLMMIEKNNNVILEVIVNWIKGVKFD